MRHSKTNDVIANTMGTDVDAEHSCCYQSLSATQHCTVPCRQWYVRRIQWTGLKWDGMPYRHFFGCLETIPPFLFQEMPYHYVAWPLRITMHLMCYNGEVWFSTQNARTRNRLFAGLCRTHWSSHHSLRVPGWIWKRIPGREEKGKGRLWWKETGFHTGASCFPLPAVAVKLTE